MDEQKTFPPAKTFTYEVLSGDSKRATVRFPSDAEWIERARSMKTYRTPLGRGKSESHTPNTEQADLALYQKVRVDGSPDLDEFEAAYIISKLEACKIKESGRDGSRFRVVLRSKGVDTEHVLKIPTKRQTMEYGRESVRIIDQRRSQEIRVSIEPSAGLYDQLLDHVTGYEGPVPIIHKDTVVVEVLNLIAAVEDDDPED